MFKWLKNTRHSYIPINSNIFKMKDLDFAESLQTSKLPTDGWHDGKNV